MSQRGEYRPIFSVIVDSPEFQALDSDARLLWYTLKMSLGPLGIGIVYDDQLSERSGIPPRRVAAARRLLEREGAWLIREGRLHWLRNGLRFEPNIVLENQNHRIFVEKEMRGLPKAAIVNRFAVYYELEPPFPDLLDPNQPPPTPKTSHRDPLPAPPKATRNGPNRDPDGIGMASEGDRNGIPDPKPLPLPLHPLNLPEVRETSPAPAHEDPGSPAANGNGAHPPDPLACWLGEHAAAIDAVPLLASPTLRTTLHSLYGPPGMRPKAWAGPDGRAVPDPERPRLFASAAVGYAAEPGRRQFITNEFQGALRRTIADEATLPRGSPNGAPDFGDETRRDRQRTEEARRRATRNVAEERAEEDRKREQDERDLRAWYEDRPPDEKRAIQADAKGRLETMQRLTGGHMREAQEVAALLEATRSARDGKAAD